MPMMPQLLNRVLNGQRLDQSRRALPPLLDFPGIIDTIAVCDDGGTPDTI